MHDRGVFLPHKVKVWTSQCLNLKSDMMIFGYRGFWPSDPRKPSEKEILMDMIAMMNYFQETYKGKNVQRVLWGKALGAAVATAGALGHNRKKDEEHVPVHDTLVLESPFISLPATL